MKNFLTIVFIFFSIPGLFGQKDGENERIHNMVNKEVEKCMDLYKDLHKNPELSLMEFETSKKMANELKLIGFEVTTGVGGNGVVGVFKNGKGKTIMLRTDMDALPVKPAVITVGAINGGTKHNIIPEEVKMLLTLRFFDEDVYEQMKHSLIRITRGAAIAAGLPENKMPLVEFGNQFTPPVMNNPDLVLQTVKYMKEILGDKNVIQVDPATVAEDFGKYGKTEEKIPIALFWLGGVNEDRYNDHIEKNTYLPPLHNSSFAPDFNPTFKCGVNAMTKAVINLFGN